MYCSQYRPPMAYCMASCRVGDYTTQACCTVITRPQGRLPRFTASGIVGRRSAHGRPDAGQRWQPVRYDFPMAVTLLITAFYSATRFHPAPTTVLHTFSSAAGTNPFGGLVQASNGLLYGMTNLGGNFSQG